MKLWDIVDCKLGVLVPARQKEDYVQVLKRRRVFAGCMNILGLFGLAVYAILVHQSTLHDFSRGFYLGACGGIELGALVLQLRLHYLIKHADARQQAQLEETDERQNLIIQKAFFLSALLTIFLAVGAMLVLVAVNLQAFFAVLGMLIVLCLTFLFGYCYYSKKM